MVDGDEDVRRLREVFTPFDPAGRPGTSGPPLVLTARVYPAGSGRRRAHAQWRWAAIVAAAVVVAVVTPVAVLSSRHAAPAATSVAPRMSYDHVRWVSYVNDRLVGSTDRWWNGVTGREVKRNASGAVVSDVTVHLPPSSSGAASSVDSTGTVGPTTPPTAGVDYQADDFPGSIPTDAAGVSTYLSAASPDVVAQRVGSLLLQRHVQPGQMAVLVSLVEHAPALSAPQRVDAPNGESVVLLHLADAGNASGAGTYVVLSSDRSKVVGQMDKSGGDTIWTLIVASDLTEGTS